jgi:spectinomycin phosphotransferase
MLETPDLEEVKIVACLQNEYGLPVIAVTFLPLGADVNTAVYRVVAGDTTPYFLKLRRGTFDEISVALPKFLSDQGIKQIIPPLATRTGQLWANLASLTTILFPFVEGHNGYEVHLTDHHWAEFGTALKRIHSAEVPPALVSRIRRETYSPQGRETVKTFLARMEDEVFDDPIAIELATFLKSKRVEVLDLVERAEQLALALQAQPPESIVCHSDIHAGNILIGTDGAFYMVDWDEPILAPKERDLMYIGSGLLASGLTPQEEKECFYQTYGPTPVHSTALAYYRYERIVQDIAAYCEQLLLTDKGGKDRAQSLHYLKSNFLPNGTIEIAYQSDQTR